MKISKSAIVRTIILFFSIINVVLDACGIRLLPIDNEAIGDAVSLIMLAASAVAAWWKNNSFTQRAITADEYLKELKEKE